VRQQLQNKIGETNMTHKDDAALRMTENHYSCSQAVLSSYGGELGLSAEQILKLAVPFGGGIGGQGKTCGAITGALMIIGLLEGSNDPGNREAKQHVYARVQEFCARFQARNGSCDCRDLLGVDLSQPGGYDLARERNRFKTVCPQYISSAVEILEEMLSLDSRP